MFDKIQSNNCYFVNPQIERDRFISDDEMNNKEGFNGKSTNGHFWPKKMKKA